MIQWIAIPIVYILLVATFGLIDVEASRLDFEPVTVFLIMILLVALALLILRDAGRRQEWAHSLYVWLFGGSVLFLLSLTLWATIGIRAALDGHHFGIKSPPPSRSLEQGLGRQARDV
jgi:ethanolamine transporter EutH